MRTESLARSRAASSAGVAFFGLLVFIAVVYANPGNWFDGLEAIGFAKIAAGLSLAALGGSWLLYNRRVTVGGAAGWSLLALFALVGLSATWSFWPKYSLDTFTDGLKYLAIFVLIVNTVDNRSRLATIVRVLALASVIPAVGATWSHAHGEHLVEGDRAGWIGIFGNPNDLSYFLVVGVAMVWGSFAVAKTPLRKVAWLTLLVPIGIGIYLAQSRSGMFASLMVCAYYLASSWKRLPIVLGVGAMLAFVVIASPHNPWRNRSDAATAYGEDVSAKGRYDAWRTGMNMVKDRPLTGVGAGAFMIAWPEYAPGDVGDVRTEHNTYVQLTSELGIPALLLFLTTLLAAALNAYQASRQSSEVRPLARAVLGGLLGFALCSVWGGIAWSWPIYMVFGLAIAARRIAAGAVVTEPVINKVQSHRYATLAPVPALASRS